MGNTPAQYLGKIKRVNLASKVSIVTGANTGIGYITARELAVMGSRVFVACRSKERAEEAIARMKTETQKQDLPVEFLPLDLASLKSVDSAVAEFQAKNLPLHILVNNAGVMALPERTTTVDGFETQFGVNHIGHFYLTTLLLPILKSSAPARIVNVSSAAHTAGKIRWDDPNFNKDYAPWGAYAQSKIANILFTVELQRRLNEEGSKITTYAVHPGFVKTELMRNINAPGFILNLVSNVAAKTVEDGALTSLTTATDPDIEGPEHGGKYWADSVPKEPTALAKNLEDAKKLWDFTEVLISDAKKAAI